MAKKAKKQPRLFAIEMTLGAIINDTEPSDEEVEKLMDLQVGESATIYDRYGEDKIAVKRTR